MLKKNYMYLLVNVLILDDTDLNYYFTSVYVNKFVRIIKSELTDPLNRQSAQIVPVKTEP
jgi:hypothetical protein